MDARDTEAGRWPLAAPLVKRSLLQSAALGAGAALVTLLYLNALAQGSAAAEGRVLGLLLLVIGSHLGAILACHAGFFRDVLALDRQRDRPRPDRAVLERGFARVVNAPRYWFVRSFGWFVLGAFDLSLARHLLDPDGFPWILLFIRTAGSTAGAFLFASLLFFLLKREFAPLRSSLGAALGEGGDLHRFVQPVGIRAKVVVGVTGALLVATLYGGVMGHVRSQRTAESAAVALGGRLLGEVGGGADAGTVARQAERLGIADHVIVVDPMADPGLTGLAPFLDRFEIEHVRASPDGGDSRGIDSAHHFAWRALPDGRLGLAVSSAARFDAHVPSMVGALGAFLGLVILVTLVAAWLLASDLERAVRRLGYEVSRIASGDLRRGRPRFWEDELGRLAGQVDDMAGSLGAMIVGMRQTADEVEAAAGDVAGASQRLVASSEQQLAGNDALRASIQGVTGPASGIRGAASELTISVEEGSASILQMRNAGGQLDENASTLLARVDEVSGAVEELIRSVRDVLEHAEHLSGAAVDTSSSMEQMAASLREVDGNAVETARLSEEVVTRAEGGARQVRQTRDGMERIRETTEMARGVIHGLGDRTHEIGEIVNVIDDVAEETNLLALNAAIIAAQAGENGRAFSVVAEEIKGLADRVLSSTKQIEGVIRSVQDETANAVRAIEEGSRVVVEGVSQAEHAGEALETITSAARDSGRRIGEIVTAVAEQTKASTHVVGLMERVRTGVEHIRRAGREQDRGNESMLASTEVMREVARHVRNTTAEQAQGAGRIAEGVAAVSAAVERINGFLSEQTRACTEADSEVDRSETRTREHGALARDLDDAVGHMRHNAERLRTAVERFQL